MNDKTLNLTDMHITNIGLNEGIIVAEENIGYIIENMFTNPCYEKIKIYKEVKFNGGIVKCSMQLSEKKAIIDSNGDLFLLSDNNPTIKHCVNAVKFANLNNGAFTFIFMDNDYMWNAINYLNEDDFGNINNNECNIIPLEQANKVLYKEFYNANLIAYLYEDRKVKIGITYIEDKFWEDQFRVTYHVDNVNDILQAANVAILVLDYKIMIYDLDNSKISKYSFEFDDRIMNVYSSDDSVYIIVRTETEVYYFEPHDEYLEIIKYCKNLDELFTVLTEKLFHANYFLLHEDLVCAVFNDYVFMFGSNKLCTVFPDKIQLNEDLYYIKDESNDDVNEIYSNNSKLVVSSTIEKVSWEDGNIIRLPSGICNVEIQNNQCIVLCEDGNIYTWGIVNMYMSLFDNGIINDLHTERAFRSCYSSVPDYNVFRINLSIPAISFGADKEKSNIKSANF